MNVKQIKNSILALLFVASLFAGSALNTDTASAYVCPAGLEYHASDNACWAKETKSITKGNNQSSTFAQKCQGGTVTNVNGNSATCETFTRSNTAPTNDDGQPASFSCPAGQEYHASDNKCWTADTKTITKGNNPTDSFTSKCQGGQISNVNGNSATCTTYTASNSNPAIAQSANANLAYCSKKYVSSGVENLTKERAACEAGQTGKDCSTLTGSEKTACEDGKANPPANGGGGGGGGGSAQGSGSCGGARTNLISCDGTGVDALGNVLKQVLQILTIMIGIVAVGGIAYGAIMYASAQDNSGQTQKAIEVIRNVLIGILLYGFMIAIINWLLPGAVFG